MLKTDNYGIPYATLQDEIINIPVIDSEATILIDKLLKEREFKGEIFTKDFKAKLESLEATDLTDVNKRITDAVKKILENKQDIKANTETISNNSKDVDTLNEDIINVKADILNLKTALDLDKDGDILDTLADVINTINTSDGDILKQVAQKAEKETVELLKNEIVTLENKVNNIKTTNIIVDKVTNKQYELVVEDGVLSVKVTDDSVLEVGYEALILPNANNITEDINLPSEADQCMVTWISEDLNYISATGKVTRPSIDEEDVIVKLIATLTYNDKTREKEFLCKVIHMSDKEQVQEDYYKLTLDNIDNVTENMLLPTSIGYSNVTWSSNKKDVISDDGLLLRVPVVPDEDIKVELQATISINSESLMKYFVVTVPAREKTQQEKAYEALEKIPDIENANAIVSDLTLVNTIDEFTISWTSSNTGVISNLGEVTRPEYLKEDIEVTLKANIDLTPKKRSNKQIVFKEFKVTVLSLKAKDILEQSKQEFNLLITEVTTETIDLPTVVGLCSVSWTSNNEDVITNTGVVTLPTEEDVQVTMNATLTLEDQATYKEFVLTVKHI